MNLPCWHVLAWRRVEVTPTEFSKAVRQMRCLGVSVRDGDTSRETGRQGETVWGGDFHGHKIGLAWEWGEVSEGVVALVDPLTILSNVSVITDDGVAFGSGDLILQLNCAVNALKWQPAVRRTKAFAPIGSAKNRDAAAALQGFVGA